MRDERPLTLTTLLLTHTWGFNFEEIPRIKIPTHIGDNVLPNFGEELISGMVMEIRGTYKIKYQPMGKKEVELDFQIVTDRLKYTCLQNSKN